MSPTVPEARMPEALPAALRLSAVLRGAATVVLRYGLVVIVLWFGAFKFTAAEAQAIQPLLGHSPLLRWLYDVTDVQGASRLIGTAEAVVAVLIALRPVAPRLSALGSLGAVAMFLTTLSFLATTPGVWVHVDGFLVPNQTGAFLLKDALPLGGALWTASEALAASARIAAAELPAAARSR